MFSIKCLRGALSFFHPVPPTDGLHFLCKFLQTGFRHHFKIQKQRFLRPTVIKNKTKTRKYFRFVFPFFFAFLFYKETINAHNSIKSIYFSIIIPTTRDVILFIATHDNKASLGFEPDTRHLNMSKMICHFNHLEFLGFQPVDHSSLK